MNALRTPRVVALGLVGLLSVLVVAAVAPGVSAQSAQCSPGGSSAPPKGNMAIDVSGSSVSVSGTFDYTDRPLATINEVTVELVAGRGQVLPANSKQTVFKGQVPTYRLEGWTRNLGWNGPYTAKVIVKGDVPTSGPQTLTCSGAFAVEVSPAAPADVKAVPEGEDGVTVTWDKNKEPDIVLYEVHRAPKDGDFVAVAQTSPDLTTLNDRPSVGDWRYVVVAIRRGAGDDGIASGPSNEAAATVVVPPAPASTTTAPGGGGAGGGQPPPTTLQKTDTGIVISSASTGAGGAARPAGGGKVDLSRFGSLGRSTTRQIDAPDPGFDETLPFAPGDQPTVLEEDETQELGADDPNRDRAVGQDLISDDSDRRRSLTFVAFGLLLFVMSMGGLWMRGEVKRADELEALEPTAPPPSGAGPPAPRPPTVPGPYPRPASAVPGEPYAPPSPPPPVTARVPAPPSSRRRLGSPAATSSEPAPAPPAPAPVAQTARAADAPEHRSARRVPRRAVRDADPLAGMTPLSPPPPRPWSARRPIEAPGLDVPDPEPEPEAREQHAARRARAAPQSGGTRARRSERRLPVR